MAETIDAAGATLAVVRTELARTPPSVAVELHLKCDIGCGRSEGGGPGDSRGGSGSGDRRRMESSGAEGARLGGNPSPGRDPSPGREEQSGGSAERCVRLRLRPEPFHEALAATQQARPDGHRVASTQVK